MVGSLATSIFAQITGPTPLAWRWYQPTSAAPGGNLAVKGDLVYVASGSRMYCLERESGNQKWRFPAAQPLPGVFRTGVLASDDAIIAYADNGSFFGVNPENGQQSWVYNSPVAVSGQPIMVGKYVVFATGDSSLMALNAKDGSPAWKKPQRIFDGIQGSLTAYYDNVLFATSAQEILSVNIGTQNKNWGRKFGSLPTDIKPVVFGDTVYINSNTFLVGISAIDGTRKFQSDTNELLFRNPSVNIDGVACVTQGGGFVAFDLSGKPKLKKAVELQSLAVVDPVMVGKSAVVATGNGKIHLIDVATGKTKWNYTMRPVMKLKDENDKPVTFVQAATTPYLLSDALMIMARDGSILNFDSKNGVDLTPPEVKMVYPNPGDPINATPDPEFSLYFTIKDETVGLDMSTVKVTVDEVPVEATPASGDYYLVSFSFSGKNRPLQDGRRVIRVVASDWLGNTISKDFALTVDSTIAKPKKKDAPDATKGGGPKGGKSGGGGGSGNSG